jgi:hypothetical protein
VSEQFADRDCRLLNSIRSTGGAIAIAIYSSLIHSKATHDLIPDVAAAAVKAGLPSSSLEPFIGMRRSINPTGDMANKANSRFDFKVRIWSTGRQRRYCSNNCGWSGR